ncbi:MAG: protein kinase [Actinomycetota bacterium]
MLSGQGGSSLVYRAHDRETGRRVALKVARSDTPDAVHRLRREAELLQRITHPNVVRVIDWGLITETPVLVTEWIDGPSLAEMLRDCGPLDPQIVLDLAAPVATALDTLHERGVVHRDLSLRNVLVDSTTNAPVLIDLGLSRSNDLSVTSDAGFTGTPRYVAPEVIRGLMVDGRADQYSFAVILHELLAGQSPFPETDNAATALYQQLDATPEPLREAKPTIDHHMEAAVLRALSKDPDDRFADCSSMVRALTGTDDRPGGSLGLVRSSAGTIGRRAGSVLVGAAVVAGLLALAVGMWALFGGGDDPTPQAASGQPVADLTDDGGPTATADGAETRQVASADDTESDDDRGANGTAGAIQPADDDGSNETNTTSPESASPTTPSSTATSTGGSSTPPSSPAGPSTSAAPVVDPVGVFSGQAAALPCNLLPVTGFESGTAGADYFGDSVERVMAGEGIGGSAALLVEGSDGWGQYGQAVGITPSDRYGFSLWYRSGGDDTDLRFGIAYLDAGWGSLNGTGRDVALAPSDQWRQVTVYTDGIPADAAYAVPWVYRSAGSAPMYVDELVIASLGGCADELLGRGN